MKTETLVKKVYRATPEEQRLISQVLSASEPLQHSLSEVLSEVKKKSSVSPLLQAMVELVTEVSREVTIPDDLAAKDTWEKLVTVLTSKEVLDKFAPADPLASARLKGVKIKRELLYGDGHPLTSEGVAALLNLTRQAVDKRRRHGQLLGVSLGRRGYLYPVCQFREEKVLPGLERVLAQLKEWDPWTQLMFLKTGDMRLGGETPISRLKAGDIEGVVWAAACYGQQIAA